MVDCLAYRVPAHLQKIISSSRIERVTCEFLHMMDGNKKSQQWNSVRDRGKQEIAMAKSGMIWEFLRIDKDCEG
jgi:hypothetical protein